MIDLNGPERKATSGFTMDRKQLAMRRQFAGRREWRLLLVLPVLLVLIFTFMQSHIQAIMQPRQTVSLLPEAIALTPAAKPDLAALALPTSDELTNAQPFAETLIRDGGERLQLGARDGLTVAWALRRRALDLAALPIPQRVDARDLMLYEARVGSAVNLSGRLEEAVAEPRIEGSRLLLALEEGQWAEVFAPVTPDAFVLGGEVTVAGRFLGHAAPGTAWISAHIVRLADQTAATGGDYRLGGAWKLPEDLFSSIDDERTIIETRAYYHLLHQVQLDLTSPEVEAQVVSANLKADEIHREPARWRGHPMVVTGYVYQAMEDRDVARDRPFGIDRAMRILLWKRDIGPITETINGKEVTNLKSVLRLFEVAVVSSQPLPSVGDSLVINGRFLKFHAIPVKADSLRDRVNKISRQSDRIYPYFLVGSSYKQLEKPVQADIGPAQWIVAGIAMAALALIAWFTVRDMRSNAAMGGVVQKLRTSRRKLAAERKAEAPPTTPPPPAGPETTP